MALLDNHLPDDKTIVKHGSAENCININAIEKIKLRDVIENVNCNPMAGNTLE